MTSIIVLLSLLLITSSIICFILIRLYKLLFIISNSMRENRKDFCEPFVNKKDEKKYIATWFNSTTSNIEEICVEASNEDEAYENIFDIMNQKDTSNINHSYEDVHTFICENDYEKIKPSLNNDNLKKSYVVTEDDYENQFDSWPY